MSKNIDDHGGRHRRPRDAGPRGRPASARARLDRQLARHAARHGEAPRAAGTASRWTRSTSPACAARAWAHMLRGRIQAAGRVCGLPAVIRRRASRTWCWAWAATSACRAAWWRAARRAAGAGERRRRAAAVQQVAAAVARRVAVRLRRRRRARPPKAVVTGNPVRAEIAAMPPPAERFANRSGPLRVLVVGGSLGARVLNETCRGARADAGRPRPVRDAPDGREEHRRAARRVRAGRRRRRTWSPVHRRHGAPPTRMRPGDLPRRRDHRERAARGRRRQRARASRCEHHLPPARQRGLDGARRRRRVHLPQGDLKPRQLATLLQTRRRETASAMAEAAQASAGATPMRRRAVLEELSEGRA